MTKIICTNMKNGIHHVFTMCIVAIPLWLLYELSILVASKAEPKEGV